MRLLRFVFILSCLSAAIGIARAQSFSVTPNTIPIVATPGVNNLPFQVPVTYSPTNYDWTKVTVTSDSSWVTPSIDSTTGNLALAFSTSGLVKRTYTATITLSDGTRTAQAYVQATVSPMSVTRLVADPTRALVYGLQQDSTNAGAVLVYDPIKASYVGAITVGNKPCDLAISKDGSEALVICSASQAISVIDLAKQVVRDTIPVTPYTDWGPTDTSAHVAYGPGNIIYYVDGAWAPVLHVFDRTTKATVQNVMIDPTSGNGWGGLVLSPDQRSLFGWAQFGWSAGWLGCYISKYAVGSDGKLTYQTETNSTYPTGLGRDPLNTPAMIGADGKLLVIKQEVVDPNSIGTVVQSTPTPIFAISPNAEILSTQSAIYSSSTGNKVYDLPTQSTVQAITWDYSRLVYFDATAKALAALDLTKALSLSTLGLNRAPVDQGIVLAPTQLQWSPVLGVSKYQVYLGTSLSAVTAATTTSAEYLGTATTTALNLSTTLTPGTTYYWRVDAVGANGVATGPVTSFTVSSIASDTSSISAATVQVQKAYPVSVGLSSASAGKSWSAKSDVAWISFGAASGVTPATLNVYLDATQLSAGTSQGNISVTTPEGAFNIPVKLRVDPLALTVVRSDPLGPKVYAISEATVTTGTSRAYLLEIDSLLQKVTRVVPVGTSATDLAIHHGDNRVYVPNWQPGGLLAVNLTTFKIDRTFATAPFGGVGYSNNDVYRVSPGVAGRLVTEAEDQWVNINILDTSTGGSVGKTGVREGGGQCDPTGRYYYHGDNNSSGSAMHKLDMAGDSLKEVATSSSTSVGYYGSRTVVVSEDGSHVYWDGVAFDANLKVLAKLGEEIYATSRDGRYAFSQKRVYNVGTLDIAGTMPASLGTAFAYNTATGQIVGQVGTGLTFYAPFGANVLGAGLAPADGAVVSTVSQLAWTAMPGVDSYRVYVGTSATAVNQATTSSPEYVGNTSANSMSLPAGVTTGKTYYWRVDLVVGGSVVASQTQSFAYSAVVPGVTKVDAVTVQGYTAGALIALNSTAGGQAWSASAADAWVKLATTTGTVPASIAVTLDASQLSPGTSTSSITINGTWGTLTIPVTLRVDPLALTVIRSDPLSSKVYAINEPTVTTGTSRAFLLEIDTATEQVVRSVQVGSSATDLAIHHGDNRVYVPNWQAGGIVGVNLTTFAIDRNLATPPQGGYAGDDAYRIAAGVAGRLVTEAEDQWININLYDTTTGTKLTRTGQREGGGQFDPAGRYYFHGDNNISNASLHKLDTTGDAFSEVAKSPEGSIAGYGSRNVVMTEDGLRVFWGGRMFDTATVQPQWAISDEIYSATKDGRYAVGAAKIYDTTLRQAVLGVPAGAGKVSAVNSQTSKLVVQNGTRIAFYKIDPNVALAAPALAAPGSVGTTSLKLSWTVDGFQTGFTLQMRTSGTASWTDITSAVAGTATSYSVTALTPGTAYDFRMKADSPASSSAWSNVVSATTTAMLPSFSQQPVSQVVALGGTATFSVTVAYPTGATYQWYKDGQPISGATSSTLTIANVSESDAGSYAVKVTNSAGTVTSVAATLVAGNSRIVNFSIRSASGTGAQVLVVGFATSGGLKPLLLRGIGPGLAGFGVTGTLADPQLSLYAGQTYLMGNDNWSTSPTGAAQLASIAAQLGAFSLAQGSLDSTLYANLYSGSYTIQISGAQGTSGIALAEIYDANVNTVPRLVNVSARTQVGTGDSALIGGFVIAGSGRKTVLIRAIGPSLAQYGVTGVLANPRLDVYRNGSSAAIASNDDWGGDSALAATFAQVGAFPLDSASKDAAVVLTLDPGSYSGMVTGVGATTGIALLEVYEIR